MFFSPNHIYSHDELLNYVRRIDNTVEDTGVGRYGDKALTNTGPRLASSELLSRANTAISQWLIVFAKKYDLILK